jgi:hypothetical protein
MEWEVKARINKTSGLQTFRVPSNSVTGARQAAMDMYNIPSSEIFSVMPIYSNNNSSSSQSAPSYSGESGGFGSVIGGSVLTIFIAYLFFAFFAPWILMLLGVVVGFKVTKNDGVGLILAVAMGFGGFHAGKILQNKYFFSETNNQAPVEKVAQPNQKAPQ